MTSMVIASTKLFGTITVSTIQLPFPIGDSNYETMVFADDNEYWNHTMVRSETELGAIRAHINLIQAVTKGEKDGKTDS